MTLVGNIDVPIDREPVLAGPVEMRGWFVYNDKPALAVTLTVDGEYAGRCEVGNVPRPDVADALGNPQLVMSGWCIPIELPPGTTHRELVVHVWAAPTVPPVQLHRTLRVCDPESSEGNLLVSRRSAIGGLDAPVEGSEVSPGYVRLVGWVLGPTGPVRAVQVIVNGQNCGNARLGLPRPDVAAKERSAHAVISGFECYVDLREIPSRGDRVTFEVVAIVQGRDPTVIARRLVKVAERLTEDAVSPVQHKRVVDRRARRPGESLNLVVFAHHLGYGGAQLWLSELLRRSGAGRAYRCVVVAPQSGPLTRELRAMGISTHITQDFGLSEIDIYQGRISEISNWIESNDFNAALVNTLPNFYFTTAAHNSGIPTMWAIHESWTPDEFWLYALKHHQTDRRVAARAWESLLRADVVSFVAEATCRKFEKKVGDRRSVVIPYGIDIEAVDSYCADVSREDARSRLNLPMDANIVLSVGTLEPAKGQAILAAAFRDELADSGENVLVLVGDAGGEYSKGVRQYVAEAELGKAVMVVPVVTNPFPWYRAADVFVGSSDIESFPRTLLEAMAFGLLTTATTVYGIPELLSDGITGLLYAPSDYEEMKSALRRVIAMDPAERRALGDAGRRLVRDHYRSESYVCDVMALLNGLREMPDDTPRDILVRRGSDRWRRAESVGEPGTSERGTLTGRLRRGPGMGNSQGRGT